MKFFIFYLDSIPDNDFNNTLPLTNKQQSKVNIFISIKKKDHLNSLIIQINREIQVDETTGTRTFRDESGRRRYLCMESSCINTLKRQNDRFCGK
jgi:hypothetical protein